LDIFYLINYLYLHGPAPKGPAALLSGDANGDGVVTPLDIFYLINYLLLAGPRPNAIPVTPQVTVIVSGAEAAHLSGSIALGKPVLRDGHYVVPVIMTTEAGSVTPQAMSLRIHIDGEVGTAAVRRAGARRISRSRSKPVNSTATISRTWSPMAISCSARRVRRSSLRSTSRQATSRSRSIRN